MRVHVEVWGPLRDAVPSGAVWVEVAVGSTVLEVAQALSLPDPAILDRCAFAIDETLVARDTAVVDGARVTVLPPVSGG